MNGLAIEIPGFLDPVGDAQATFRAVLDAMARPGRICSIAAKLQPPLSLACATAAVALTLIDQETTLFLDVPMQGAGPWLAFHAGAAIVEDPWQADFVLASSLPDLTTLMAGTDEAPEVSATLILQIDALGSGSSYRLDGPGLKEPFMLLAAGLPGDFAAIWRRNHARFPRGIDLVLCAGDRLAALPRSVSVEQV